MTGLLISSVWCRILGSFHKNTCINLNGYIQALGINFHIEPIIADVSCIVNHRWWALPDTATCCACPVVCAGTHINEKPI